MLMAVRAPKVGTRCTAAAAWRLGQEWLKTTSDLLGLRLSRQGGLVGVGGVHQRSADRQHTEQAADHLVGRLPRGSREHSVAGSQTLCRRELLAGIQHLL